MLWDRPVVIGRFQATPMLSNALQLTPMPSNALQLNSNALQSNAVWQEAMPKIDIFARLWTAIGAGTSCRFEQPTWTSRHLAVRLRKQARLIDLTGGFPRPPRRWGGAMGPPGRCSLASGMKWRVMLEVVGPDRIIGVHEVGGRASVAE